jgi:hypothetical protein
MKVKLNLQKPINKRILSDTYYYTCEDKASVGRTLAGFLRFIRTKEKETSKVRAYYLVNPEVLCFKCPIERAYEKYKSFYDAGNAVKGPYIPKTPEGLIKKILRNMMRYKARERKIFRKIIVLRFKPKDLEHSNIMTLPKEKLLKAYYNVHVSLRDLMTKIKYTNE